MFNSFTGPESSISSTTNGGVGLSQRYVAEFMEILDSSELDQLKKKCYPTTPKFSPSEGVVSQHLYISIPFPEHMIGSESYAESNLYSNIIVDSNGVLFELLLEYNEEYMSPPTNGLRIIRATEYRDTFGVLSARKFEEYIL
ncbi:hypothetical protein KBD33_00155 [Candidatus Gracilibacteria bacterium]|nr:hypothetical protein [Candidatus Gracilibacteria bacterium]